MKPTIIFIIPLTASPPLIMVIITSIKFNIPPTIVKAIASFNWSMESIAVNSFSSPIGMIGIIS